MISEKYVNKEYKFGCVLSVFNRSDKLSRTIQSLRESYVPNDFLLILVNDGSEENVIFDIDFLNHVIITKNKNYGISHSLVMGWDFVYNMNIPYMLNIDSDVLVSKNWLSKILNVHKSELSPNITTGFNGKYHKILETTSEFHVKNSIGGINLFFDRNLYPVIRPCLTQLDNIPKNIIENIDSYGKNPKIHHMYNGWDWGLMAICAKENIKKLCCCPSVIQHIGDNGITSTPKNFEQALDFKDHCVPKIIHQTWQDHDMPDRLKIMQKTVIENHADYEYIFWTDNSIDEFIKVEYPKIWDFYNSFCYKIQKIDFARLLFLYHFGGIYMDLDSYCFKNIDDILKFPISLTKAIKHQDFSEDYPFILNNAFISSEKQNLFIKTVIENIINFEYENNYEKYYKGYKEYGAILKSTGPLMITDSYLNYEFKNMINLLEENFYFGVSNRKQEQRENNVIDKYTKIEHDHHFLHVHESSWWKKNNVSIHPPKNLNRKDCNKKEAKL